MAPNPFSQAGSFGDSMSGSSGDAPSSSEKGAKNGSKAVSFNFGKMLEEGKAKWKAASVGWQSKAKEMAKDASRQAKGLKMTVKVDWFGPTIEAMKVNYARLPPGVQQAVPYVGVAVGTGTVVHLVWLRKARRERIRLNSEIDELDLAREKLAARLLSTQEQLAQALQEAKEAKMAALKASNGQNTPEVVSMAKAVADATNAAARAAQAAAKAVINQAEGCARPALPQLLSPSNPPLRSTTCV
eukprot:CAMPEP_0197859490 /NCGR_PEP_ID=MMETSP1438-20131217/34085_1 /TAXON_ID=1461541 /ORGANISM="Pterosperma sp., Strain CCMP1384" /LENGTH=242 /DNA_ID=CAMNT_0043475991 /DNA_START=187 /DNA_END=911 /DNA_ORIENTATION=-